MAEPSESMNMEGNTPSTTIVVLGKGVVGKTSLIYRFINANLPETHDPTIEDTYKTLETIAGSQREIQIQDTAGEEDYQNMLDQWIENADGIILVFAINDNESFLELDSRIERIKKNKKSIPVVLIGNKKDLEDKRQVTKKIAEEKSKELKTKYFETSALNDDISNIKKPFIYCAEETIKMKKIEGKKEVEKIDAKEKCKRCIIF